MTNVIDTTYDYMINGEAHPRIIAAVYSKLAVTEADLLSIAADSADQYRRIGRPTNAAVELHAAILDLFTNATENVRSLSKSVRAADTAVWAQDANVFVPTHVGRCSALFSRAAITVRDLFNSFHTGAAAVGRPRDLEVDLSVFCAVAPLLSGDAESVVWNFQHKNYNGLRMRFVRALATVGVEVNRATFRTVAIDNADGTKAGLLITR